MRIGIDFDNTIVCYKEAIARLAVERLEIPENVDLTKSAVRDYLRKSGREDEWTEFQGTLYGPGMKYGRPFNGLIEALESLKALGFSLSIISHRSRYPYAGVKHDLHRFAKEWIDEYLQGVGLFTGLDSCDTVHFLETKNEKMSKVSELSCMVFIDDLPELLLDARFPAKTRKVLFDPDDSAELDTSSILRVHTWSQVVDFVKDELCAH